MDGWWRHCSSLQSAGAATFEYSSSAPNFPPLLLQSELRGAVGVMPRCRRQSAPPAVPRPWRDHRNLPNPPAAPHLRQHAGPCERPVPGPVPRGLRILPLHGESWTVLRVFFTQVRQSPLQTPDVFKRPKGWEQSATLRRVLLYFILVINLFIYCTSVLLFGGNCWSLNLLCRFNPRANLRRFTPKTIIFITTQAFNI